MSWKTLRWKEEEEEDGGSFFDRFGEDIEPVRHGVVGAAASSARPEPSGAKPKPIASPEAASAASEASDSSEDDSDAAPYAAESAAADALSGAGRESFGSGSQTSATVAQRRPRQLRAEPYNKEVLGGDFWKWGPRKNSEKDGAESLDRELAEPPTSTSLWASALTVAAAAEPGGANQPAAAPSRAPLTLSAEQLQDPEWLLHQRRAAAHKNAFQLTSAFAGAAVPEPSRVHRQKHQITALAADAVRREREMFEKGLAANRKRRETVQRYGW